MESEDAIVNRIQTTTNLPQPVKSFPLRLFSAFLLVTISVGVWQWWQYYSSLDAKQARDWIDVSQMLTYDNKSTFEETVLKGHIYRVIFVTYVEPNIVLSLTMLLTFPFVINFIEKQTATPIAFFQYTFSSFNLHAARLVLDGVQYFLTGKCHCISSGAACVWLHLITKLIYYRSRGLKDSPLAAAVLLLGFGVMALMIVAAERVDLLIGLGIALIEVAFMAGGTIKFPKQVFQEKEDWADKIGLNKTRIWQNFSWNQYKSNELLVVDNQQYFVTRQERINDIRYSNTTL